LAARQAGDPGVQVRDWVYRSPWPIALKDGCILVVFARRREATGIGAVISSDNGATWSEEAIIRGGDTSVSDIGYPVGGQLDDGRVFLAYYYTEPREGGYNRAIRYIAGTHFHVADDGRPIGNALAATRRTVQGRPVRLRRSQSRRTVHVQRLRGHRLDRPALPHGATHRLPPG
jgi:hypothetical protein